MRRGGTHFWQAPTALELPPRGGVQLKRHPRPTHSLTDQHKGQYRGKKICGGFGARNTAPPLKPPPQLFPPPVSSEGGTQHFENGRHAPPPPRGVG